MCILSAIKVRHRERGERKIAWNIVLITVTNELWSSSISVNSFTKIILGEILQRISKEITNFYYFLIFSRLNKFETFKLVIIFIILEVNKIANSFCYFFFYSVYNEKVCNI